MAVTEYNSWGYPLELNDYKSALNSNSSRVFVFYGSDLALSLSLSRVDGAEFWSEESIKKNFTELISTNLFFTAPKAIRAIVSDKTALWVIEMSKKYALHDSCFLIVDGKKSYSKKTDKDGEKAELEQQLIYVKCDKLNARSRKWFLDFHCKKLGIKNENLDWVNNLDDLKYAKILQQLGFMNYMVPAESEKMDIWSQMRIDQFRKKWPIAGLCKHFETWARNNSTGDEFLEFAYNLEIERAEQSLR